LGVIWTQQVHPNALYGDRNLKIFPSAHSASWQGTANYQFCFKSRCSFGFHSGHQYKPFNLLLFMPEIHMNLLLYSHWTAASIEFAEHHLLFIFSGTVVFQLLWQIPFLLSTSCNRTSLRLCQTEEGGGGGVYPLAPSGFQMMEGTPIMCISVSCFANPDLDLPSFHGGEQTHNPRGYQSHYPHLAGEMQ
jgi:hypothetical protein